MEDNFRDLVFQHMIMAEPYSTSDGDTFEKELIEEWFKTNDTNPRTRVKLESKALILNRPLRTMIKEYLSRNKHLYSQEEVFLPKGTLQKFLDDLKTNNFNEIKNNWMIEPEFRVFIKNLDKDYSAFFYACEFCSFEITSLIFDYLFDNNYLNKIKSPAEWKPVHFEALIEKCLIEKNKEKLQSLLVYNADMAKLKEDFLTCILSKQIEESSNLEQIKWLMEFDKSLLNKKNQPDGNTPILLATKFNHLNLVEYFLGLDADKEVFNKNHENCFYHAIKNKNKEMLRTLFGEEISSRSVLISTIIKYKSDLLLMQSIIDLDKSFVNEMDNTTNETPLYFACKENNISIVELLNKNDVDYSIVCTLIKETAFHLACDKGFIPLIKLLIKYGCDINALDINEETPIYRAIRNQNLSVIGILLEENAEVYLENKDDLSPLDVSKKEIKRFIHKKMNDMKIKEKTRVDILMKRMNQIQEGIDKKLNEKEDKVVSASKINDLQKRLNNTLLFSLNSTQLISCSVDRSIKIWDVADEVCLNTLSEHKNTVRCIKQMKNGNLMSSSSDGTVKIWDLKSGKCVRTLQLESRFSSNLKIMKNGDLLVGLSDGKIKILNMDTWKSVCVLNGHTNWIRSVKCLSNGNIVSASFDKSIRVWDLNAENENKCIRVIEAHDEQIAAVKLSKAEHLFSCSFDRTIKKWDLSTGDCLKTLRGHADKIRSIKLMNNENYLISGAWDRTIKIWDVENEACINSIPTSSPIRSLKLISSDYLLSGNNNGEIQVWSLAENKSIKTFKAHNECIMSLKFLKNNSF